MVLTWLVASGPPYYLLFPLTAGFLYVIGALFGKHASNGGVSPWTLAAFANFCAAAFMSVFWMLGGNPVELSSLWQPMVIGALYVIGQVFILAAVSYGDVSVAMPVASVKVIIVAALMVFMTAKPPSIATWIAAGLAAIGVFLINLVASKSEKRRVMLTVLLAVSGVTAFALFDVCIQNWSPAWGTGRLLPFSFWCAGLLTIFMLPMLPERKISARAAITSTTWRSLLLSGTFIAGQAMFMVYGLSAYAGQGDAAQMNVVYSLRGLWGVLLAWLFARQFGGAEAELPRSTMGGRLVGAILLVAAVIVTILGA